MIRVKIRSEENFRPRRTLPCVFSRQTKSFDWPTYFKVRKSTVELDIELHLESFSGVQYVTVQLEPRRRTKILKVSLGQQL